MTSDQNDAHRSIDRLVAAFFDSVSFAAGEWPRYDRIRSLFLPNGLLIKGSSVGTEVTSVDEFIAPRQKTFDAGILTEFRETELSATTTVFGQAAERESRYDKSGVSAGEPLSGTGIIFTQFVLTASGWLISAMAWDDERDGLVLGDRSVAGRVP